MEILDIVNENDDVVGALSRDEIHRDGLIHRASHMLLFNSAHQVFLQKRSMSKDNDPGLWDSSSAGHVDTGESYRQCAVRELEEELGLIISTDDLTMRFKLRPVSATGMEFAVVYTLISDQPLTLDSTEIDDGKWLNLDNVDFWIAERPQDLSAAFKLIWQRLRPLL